jgi:SAM-dependent methyltransferase
MITRIKGITGESKMDKLLPDRLKALWQCVPQNYLTRTEFSAEQEQLLDLYRKIWGRALLLDGLSDLQESILMEIGRYTGCDDPTEIRLRCTQALSLMKSEWKGKVSSEDRQSVERFYDENSAMIYELMWWHTLCDDGSPLAYVVALHFAEKHGCRHYLDFGAGVGSGAILFSRHGFDVTLADISSSMLDFSKWRLELRELPARSIDLKVSRLPENSFDIVAAMDVFEHLVDPVETVDELWHVLRPGGFLFGRFHAEVDEDRPHHIVQDFAPTVERLKTLGFIEVWKDEWLWGHQVFQKT